MPPRKKKTAESIERHESRLEWMERIHRAVLPTLFELPYHSTLLHRFQINESLQGSPNLLFYGARGFPLEYMAYGLFPDFSQWTKQVCLWKEKLPYFDYQGQLLELQCRHPEFTKHLDLLCDFMKHILTTRCMYQSKYIFLIRDMDVLTQSDMRYVFRVLLERYSNNVLFLATTHTLSKIEPPLKSRFILIRVPYPSSCTGSRYALLESIGEQTTPIAAKKETPTSWMDGLATLKSPLDVRQVAYERFQKGDAFPEFCWNLLQLSKKPHWLIQSFAQLDSQRAQSGKIARSAGNEDSGRDPLYYEKALLLFVFANTLSK